MEKFKTITSPATPFPQVNVDTDIIVPGKCLKSIKRTGFADLAFESVRFDAQGERMENVFDDPRYAGAKILLTGDNFGCGSSREHAVWAIAEMEYRCLIGPGFADIFASNCVKNGILTVILDQKSVDRLMERARAGKDITIDLPNQTVGCGDDLLPFPYNPVHKELLLLGLDEVGQTMRSRGAITAYEARRKDMTPWLFKAATG